MTGLPRLSAGYDGVLARYYGYRFTAWLVDYLLLFGVPLLCYKVTGDLTWSGAALAAEWTPRLLSLAGAGYLVDRVSIRQLCLLGDAVRFAVAAACAVAAAVRPGLAIWLAVGLAALAGTFFEQSFVAGEKAGKLLAGEQRQAQVQTVLTGLEQIAVIAAPAVGGTLLLFRPVVFLAAACVLYGASFLLGFALPTVRTADGEKSSLLLGLRDTLCDPVLRPVVLLACGLNYMLGLINGAAAQIAGHRYGASTSALGYIYSAASIASIVVLAAAPRLIRALGLWRFGVAAALASPVLCALIVGSPDLALFAVGLGGFMAVDSLYSVYMRTSRVERVPTSVYGSTVAAFGLVVIVPMPVAGLTLSLIGHHADPRVVLGVAAAAALMLAAALAPGLSRNRATPWPWPDPAAVRESVMADR